tara:strand:- start:73 stop:753 length:681 start_codon:yes stop_codon:yes gene_type:complete
MNAFDRAWALTKDFRFLRRKFDEKRKAGEPYTMQEALSAIDTNRILGGYDNKTGEIFANLQASDLHMTDQGMPAYRGRRNTTDEEKEASLLETLRHEGDHKALDSILQEAIQPQNDPIPYKADTSKPNREAKEEFMDRYGRGHEYALMALDSMRRRKGSGSPRMRIGTTVAPNRRFRTLSERYPHLGYDFDDLLALERKTLGRDMNEAMGRRARENARRLMEGSDQ